MPTWMFWVLVALGALIAGRYVFNFWQLAKLTTSASRAGYLIVVGCVAVVIVLVVAIMLVYGGGVLAELFIRLFLCSWSRSWPIQVIGWAGNFGGFGLLPERP